MFISDPFRDIFQEIRFTPEQIFTNPAIKPWRKLADRENCTWDITPGHRTIRLHIKRYPPARQSPAQIEATGYDLLRQRDIPAAKVAAWAILPDGRSFIAIEDLTDYTPADKLIQSGLDFNRLLLPTANLAARLHTAGLHHRDLYLCHFMARAKEDQVDLRLIDAARVRPLPALLARRWIIKDLSQFWYSTTELPITNAQRDQWLAEYTRLTTPSNPAQLKTAIQRKSNAIARHDQRIRTREPGRNISIPK